MKRQCFANFLKADLKSEKVLGTYCCAKLMYCIKHVCFHDLIINMWTEMPAYSNSGCFKRYINEAENWHFVNCKIM